MEVLDPFMGIYGMRRFPITLYAGEWRKVLSMRRRILELIDEHEDELE